MKYWWFTEHEKGTGTVSWTWRLQAADGAVVQQSPEFDTYGAAVRSAIREGFLPAHDHWTIESKTFITHYVEGKHISVRKSGDAPAHPASRKQEP